MESRMEFGINTVLWVWPFTLKRLDVLEKIKEIGFDTVEFERECLWDPLILWEYIRNFYLQGKSERPGKDV
jgi:sugar phosphate isomerase/epimerase